MPSQQNIRATGIALVLISGSRLVDIEPQAAEIQAAITNSIPGRVTLVGPRR